MRGAAVRVSLGLLVALAACGRFGFDPVSRGVGDGAAGDGTSGGDDSAAGDGAAVSCAGGDSVCRVSCLATDPDCTTTCGDGRCVGNAGELCANCTADCATTAPVCGNGACDPGEDSDICYADCGPSPWPWTAEEADLLTRINAARTGGTVCPGMGLQTAPAIAFDPGLLPGVRERTWETAHQNVSINGNTCNGRTFAQLAAAYGFSGGVAYTGSDTASAVAAWLANASLCPVVMSSGSTMAAAAVAHDAASTFLVYFK